MRAPAREAAVGNQRPWPADKVERWGIERLGRLWGGMSPGAPRGERNGNYRHGLRTIEVAAQRRQAAAVRRELRRLVGALG